MSFIKVEGSYFSKDRKPFIPVGINYLPHYRCGNWFEDWREGEILKDLDKMADLGLNAVRIPVFWSYFEPRPGEYNGECILKYRIFIGWCRERGIYVMPFFLVGICTGFFRPPYSFGESMYEGPMLGLEKAHLKEFARHFASDEQIFLWDLSDEPYYVEFVPGHDHPHSYGYRKKSRTEVAVNWVRELAGALREVDPNHLVTVGLDNSSVCLYTGFDTEEIAPHLDVISHCLYVCPSGEETAANLYAAFTTRLYDVGKPVFLHEGPGISQSVGDKALLEGRYRAAIYGSVAAGNCGVMPWCFTDYDMDIRSLWPLNDQPHEAVFGILEPDRREKPQAKVLREFGKFAARFDWRHYRRKKSEAVLIYPERFYQKVKRDGLYGRLFFNYLCFAGAGASCDLVREDAAWEEFGLAVFPLPELLTAGTWARARRYCEEGGRLVVSGHKVMLPEKASFLGAEIMGCVKLACEDPLLFETTGETLDLQLPEGEIPLLNPQGAAVLIRSGNLPLAFSHPFGRGEVVWSALDLGALLREVNLESSAAGAVLKFVRGLIADNKDSKLIRSLTDWIEIHQWDHREAVEALFFILNPRPVEVKPAFEINSVVKEVRSYDKGKSLNLGATVLRPHEVLIVKAKLK
ncbi:MAG TPA: cellulase family glycosylhydrolase [archaeon]|nr:cellulase family glycosylhydrolase [archaeon]